MPLDCNDGAAHRTTGLLQRRHVKIDLIKCISKESNSLETVDEGLEHSEKNVYTVYDDPNRTEWITKFWLALKKVSLARLVELSGMSRRELMEIRAARDRLYGNNEQEATV